MSPYKKNQQGRRPANFTQEFSRRKRRVRIVLSSLKRLFPTPGMMLLYRTHWELLVAVMLSAQCADKRVNEVTRSLFKKYRTIGDYAHAPLRELERHIYSTGFYRSKARNIQATARLLIRTYGGKIPQTMEEMLTLPGVARKTANVVLGNAHGVVEGIAVDTHVRRLARLFGLTKEKDPGKIERDLMAIIPRREWFRFTYRMIEYGRKYCPARPLHNHENCPVTRMLRERGSV